jgi:thiol-disulfide isomerase/thioredoxin
MRWVLLALCLAFPARAEPVSFLDAEGHRLTLADFAGKLVLLDVWATWCAPCVAELPQIQALGRELAPKGLAVVALAIDREGWPKVRWHLQRQGLGDLPVYLDEERRAVEALGVKTLPAAFLFDRSGALIERIDGAHDWSAERARLEMLLGQ